MFDLYLALGICSLLLVYLCIRPRHKKGGIITQTDIQEDENSGNAANLMVDSPVTFDTFIGQNLSTELLKIHVKAANKRDRTVPHILMEGPGGTGKTTLAMCVANEIDTRLFITTPSTFKDKSSVLNFLFYPNGVCKMKKGDVLFIDEIHRLREAAAIYIYSAMQDFYIDVGGSIAALPKFTVIGATTDAGMLPSPFRDRFKVKITLDSYLTKDLSRMVVDFKNLPKEVADLIANRACGIPRIAKSLSDNVIAYSIANNEEAPTINSVIEVCKLLEIDSKGLNKSARKVISYFQNNENKAIGIVSLANTLNISRDTLEQEIYPVLFLHELLKSEGTKGKCLTNKGLNYNLNKKWR